MVDGVFFTDDRRDILYTLIDNMSVNILKISYGFMVQTRRVFLYRLDSF